MGFLTNDKLVIVGAGGAIGSTMVQTALTMKLTPNVCLYDVYAPGMEGVMEEMFHCGYDSVNLTATTDVAEAFKDAKYIISSGGAPRKAGMTREDLLAGNCKIAEELGKNIKQYCPDVKHVVVIFNPADLTGLVTLLYSGLKPSQVTTLGRSRRADGRIRQQGDDSGQAPQPDHRYRRPAPGGMGKTAHRCGTGWRQDHPAPRSQLMAEPCLLLCRNDSCRDGWRSLPVARRHIREEREISEHHDGYGHHSLY